MDGTETNVNGRSHFDYDRHGERIYRLEVEHFGEPGHEGTRQTLKRLSADVAAIKNARWLWWIVAASVMSMAVKMWFPALGAG